MFKDLLMREGSPALTQDDSATPAFEWVFSTHRTLVYRLAFALLGHPQDAEDATQEVFLRVYRRLPEYQAQRASLRTWLTQITVNACRTHRRRNFWRRRGQPLPDLDGAGQETAFVDASPWVAPEDQALLAEVRHLLRDDLAKLRPEHRTVLILHYFCDYSCAEIAQMTSSSEGTVCSRLYYARRRLQARLVAREPRNDGKEPL
ncbi:MAG TPA: RNA polymerase sigma factor [Chloroflexia bacterium]|nr:RNA polymerase sigma factor [Chloroflexia bacterium]